MDCRGAAAELLNAGYETLRWTKHSSHH